jgi:ankyrin repeat protein
MTIRDLVFSGNAVELDKALREHPSLANQEISLPDNPETAHPLHRICDAVFTRNYSEDTGIELAKLFIKYGADVNNVKQSGKDSPLTASCSLYCDALALLYIGQGASIDHQGCLGGTALHWAAWCGRDAIVKKLITMNPEINKLCINFKSTPLFWALHGYKFGGKNNVHNQLTCARLLLENGADPSIPNFEGHLPKQLLDPGDTGFAELFNTYK